MDKKERTYVFFKYGLNEKGDLIVSILSDDFVGLKGKKFKRSKELNDFVRRNISQNGLFGDSINSNPLMRSILGLFNNNHKYASGGEQMKQQPIMKTSLHLKCCWESRSGLSAESDRFSSSASMPI